MADRTATRRRRKPKPPARPRYSPTEYLAFLDTCGPDIRQEAEAGKKAVADAWREYRAAGANHKIRLAAWRERKAKKKQ